MAFGELALHLLKRTPESGQGVLGNSDAGVGDGERNAMVGSSPAHRNTAAGRRKFHRIGEQVECNLLARAAMTRMASLSSVSRSRSSKSSRIRPASIFDISRISLMTSSRYCPLPRM